MRRLLATRDATVRPFLSLLGESLARGTASGGTNSAPSVSC